MSKKIVNEDAMGGVSSPMSTLNNTPGIGNAIPASSAAMTGAQQSGTSSIGSGDKWGGDSIYTQNGKLKKTKKRKKLKESSINPYDTLGTAMAKKMKVPLAFKKKNKKTNTMTQVAGKLVNESLNSFIKLNKLNEEKWIPKKMKKGALSRELGIPEDEDIPMSVINKKIKTLQKKAEGDKKLSASESKLLHRLMAAKNMKSIKK